MPANRYRYPVGEGVPRQSERSASENKERAYIAASRRSDRSLEARVQSAFAASQIHKERTGKALKVTEDIVLKEEMYEEEDDLPARYQALMNNPLFALNPRASAYAITQMGMSDAVAARFSNRGDPSRLDEVNRQFAQVFPGFGMPLQQTPICESGPAHSPTVPGSHPPFPHSTPAQATPPYSPITQTHRSGFHHPSPQDVAFSSPFGSPASRVDSPVSANSMVPGNTMQSPPILGSPMHARSMSMSQVEPILMEAQLRATTISPGIASQSHPLAGQRRSYDEAFCSSYSPLKTPQIPGAFPSGTGMRSPDMPPPTGPPATYNRTFQRRGSSQSIPPSPGGIHPMHAAGFTTQLPANVNHFFQPQNVDRSGLFADVRQSFYTNSQSVPTTPATQGGSIVSHTNQAQFQLHGNLRQMQREKKERRRRAIQETQKASKAEKVSQVKAKAKDAPKPEPQPSVENAARHRLAKDEPTPVHLEQQTKIDTQPAEGLAVNAQCKEQQESRTELADAHESATGNFTYNLEDINFDISNFQTFSADDFNLNPFNMNFDDSFDINQFFAFPASQPENDNVQAVS